MIKRFKAIGDALRDGTVIHYGFATVLSFGHIHDLAAAHGQAGWKAWCYPPSVDLLIYAGYRRIRSAPGAIGWFAFLFGILVSLAANIVESYLTTHSVIGVVIGLYPSLGMLVATLLGHTHDRATLAVSAVGADPEVQQEQAREDQAPRDTPVQQTGELPIPRQREAPTQPAPQELLTAVIAELSAGRAVPKGEGVDFCRRVEAAIIAHGFLPPSSMTIRRRLKDMYSAAA